MHLGTSSALASFQMWFSPLNPMWFGDLVLVKPKGFCFQQAAPHFSLSSYSKGKVCSLEVKVSWSEQEGMNNVLFYCHGSAGFVPVLSGRCIMHAVANVVG